MERKLAFAAALCAVATASGRLTTVPPAQIKGQIEYDYVNCTSTVQAKGVIYWTLDLSGGTATAATRTDNNISTNGYPSDLRRYANSHDNGKQYMINPSSKTCLPPVSSPPFENPLLIPDKSVFNGTAVCPEIKTAADLCKKHSMAPSAPVTPPGPAAGPMCEVWMLGTTKYYSRKVGNSDILRAKQTESNGQLDAMSYFREYQDTLPTDIFTVPTFCSTK